MKFGKRFDIPLWAVISVICGLVIICGFFMNLLETTVGYREELFTLRWAGLDLFLDNPVQMKELIFVLPFALVTGIVTLGLAIYGATGKGKKYCRILTAIFSVLTLILALVFLFGAYFDNLIVGRIGDVVFTQSSPSCGPWFMIAGALVSLLSCLLARNKTVNLSLAESVCILAGSLVIIALFIPNVETAVSLTRYCDKVYSLSAIEIFFNTFNMTINPNKGIQLFTFTNAKFYPLVIMIVSAVVLLLSLPVSKFKNEKYADKIKIARLILWEILLILAVIYLVKLTGGDLVKIAYTESTASSKLAVDFSVYLILAASVCANLVSILDFTEKHD